MCSICSNIASKPTNCSCCRLVIFLSSFSFRKQNIDFIIEITPNQCRYYLVSTQLKFSVNISTLMGCWKWSTFEILIRFWVEMFNCSTEFRVSIKLHTTNERCEKLFDITVEGETVVQTTQKVSMKFFQVHFLHDECVDIIEFIVEMNGSIERMQIEAE